MGIDKDRLQRQMDMLWDKVQNKMDIKPQDVRKDDVDFASAFETVQQEIQTESVNMLKARFEKEKSYWENLLASKDEAAARLKKEVHEEQQKNQELKNKISEMQEAQTQLLTQTYSTMELQKRSVDLRIEETERELEKAHKEVLAFTLALKEEKQAQDKLNKEWQEKEKRSLEEFEKKEAELNNIKQDLFKRRQNELEEVSKLNEKIKELQNQVSESKTLCETERAGFQNIIIEKDNAAALLRREIEEAKAALEKEREDRRAAVMERERVSMEQRQESKKMVEELLRRENKISDLQRTIESLAAEREAIDRRKEEIERVEEELRKRREAWVDSVKGQTTQQLSISAKIFEMLTRIEGGSSIFQLRPVLKPPVPALRREASGGIDERRKYPGLMGRVFDVAAGFMYLLKRNKGIVLAVSGLTLFAVTAFLLIFQGEGVKTMRAQKLLQQGNEQFTMGNLVESLQSLEKAYGLDPRNSIIKNSLTIVLGELANKEYREGNFEQALKYTEFLNRLVPEDSDTLQLHNNILQAIGKGGGSKKAIIPPASVTVREYNTSVEPQAQSTAPETQVPASSPSVQAVPAASAPIPASSEQLIAPESIEKQSVPTGNEPAVPANKQ